MPSMWNGATEDAAASSTQSPTQITVLFVLNSTVARRQVRVLNSLHHHALPDPASCSRSFAAQLYGFHTACNWTGTMLCLYASPREPPLVTSKQWTMMVFLSVVSAVNAVVGKAVVAVPKTSDQVRYGLLDSSVEVRDRRTARQCSGPKHLYVSGLKGLPQERWCVVLPVGSPARASCSRGGEHDLANI